MGGRGSSGGGGGARGFNEGYSKYSAQHKKTVSYVKKQTGVDLNKYRSGNGETPNTTTFWDKKGPKVAVNLNKMSQSDRTKLMSLANRYGGNRLTVERAGAWMVFVDYKE